MTRIVKFSINGFPKWKDKGGVIFQGNEAVLNFWCADAAVYESRIVSQRVLEDMASQILHKLSDARCMELLQERCKQSLES